MHQRLCRNEGPRRAAGSGRSTPEGALRRLAAAALCVLLAAATCLGQTDGPIRNESPQRALLPPDEQWPVYYPRSARRSIGAAGGEVCAPEQLLHRFINLHTAMRYEEALEIARELARLAPDRPLAHYNVACALGRLHRADEALDALRRAVECGWRNVAHTSIDPDLQVLRGRERFDDLLDEMMTLAEAERITAGPLRDDPWQAVAGDLCREVPPLLRRYHVPGVTIALLRDGRCVWTSAFGVADGRNGRSMNADDVFALGAPGHLIALIAAAQLEAAERLDLDELLQEAQRLVRGPTGGPGIPARRRWPVTGSSRLSGAFGPVHQHRQPSGSGTAGPRASLVHWPVPADRRETIGLLQLAVEVAGGASFPEYCRDHVLRPLGMTHTTLLGAGDAPGKSTPGHTRLGSVLGLSIGGRGDVSLMHTTVRDLARLVESMLDGGSRDSPSEAAMVRETASRVADAGEIDLGRLGLGVYAARTGAGRRVQVADVTGGCGGLIRWYPDSGCGVVVLFNSETGPEAALRIAQLALGGE